MTNRHANLFLFPHWRGERLLNRPPQLNSHLVGWFYNTEMLQPFAKTFTYTINGYVGILTRIPSLLFMGGPATIFRAIRSIIIESVYGISFIRSWTHVPNKGRETPSPSFAYINSSLAVMFVILVTFGVASNSHASPDPVFSKRFDGHSSGEYVTSRFIHSNDMFGFSAGRSLNRTVSRDNFSHNNV